MSVYCAFFDNLHGSPLDADFLNYYGKEITDFSEGIRLFGLIGFLPEDSQTMRFFRGGEDFSFSSLVLSRIEYLVHSYIYAQRDKKQKVSAPEMLLPEYIQKNMSEKEKHISEYTVEEIQAAQDYARERMKKKKKIISSDDFEGGVFT